MWITLIFVEKHNVRFTVFLYAQFTTQTEIVRTVGFEAITMNSARLPPSGDSCWYICICNASTQHNVTHDNDYHDQKDVNNHSQQNPFFVAKITISPVHNDALYKMSIYILSFHTNCRLICTYGGAGQRVDQYYVCNHVYHAHFSSFRWIALDAKLRLLFLCCDIRYFACMSRCVNTSLTNHTSTLLINKFMSVEYKYANVRRETHAHIKLMVSRHQLGNVQMSA